MKSQFGVETTTHLLGEYPRHGPVSRYEACFCVVLCQRASCHLQGAFLIGLILMKHFIEKLTTRA